MEDTKPIRTRRRGARAIGWAVVGSLIAFALLGSTSGSALAVVGTTLNQTPPISFDDPEFQGTADECAGTPAGTWHFVLVQTAAASGTLTATFQSGAVFVVGSTKKTGSTLHFDVPAGDDTLTGASTDVVGKLLLLSHICGGGTTTTTTVTTTST
jgi:hypothetical protein